MRSGLDVWAFFNNHPDAAADTIEEGVDLSDGAADLALIACAQKIEHYGISAY